MSDSWEWPEVQSLVGSIYDPPSFFAKATAETLPIQPGKTRILDVGCGRGVIGLWALLRKGAAFVTFTDLEMSALAETRANVARQIYLGTILESQVAFTPPLSVSNISWRQAAEHDLVVFNAPQLPIRDIATEDLERMMATPSARSFRNGGADGLDIIRLFVGWYASLPLPKPLAVLGISSFLGWSTISEVFRTAGLDAEVIHRTPVPLRTQLCEKADSLIASPSELIDRALTKVKNRWFKEILTVKAS
ncbi:MAG TPA: methyltransferase [Terriglobales bacterium]|nr:methyltransferase [Terriglobales bacterium]